MKKHSIYTQASACSSRLNRAVLNRAVLNRAVLNRVVLNRVVLNRAGAVLNRALLNQFARNRLELKGDHGDGWVIGADVGRLTGVTDGRPKPSLAQLTSTSLLLW